MIFFDASAAVKAYVPEPGSASVHGAISRLKGKHYLTSAVALEVLGTLAKKWRMGALTRSEYGTARATFLNQLGVTFKLSDLREVDFTTAYELADRYRHVGAGPLDILHVASAMRLQSTSPAVTVTIASSDVAFLGVARDAGFPTFDPELEPFNNLLALSLRKYDAERAAVAIRSVAPRLPSAVTSTVFPIHIRAPPARPAPSAHPPAPLLR